MEIGIIGLGLIGGSLGLDLRSQSHKVIGVSRRAQTIERALERGVIDAGSTEFGALSSADLVVVCTPISLIVPTVKCLRDVVPPGAIITDVGSVKGRVVEPCTTLYPHFVGGHPMAGTAEQGIEAAQRDLFQGAVYAFTPVEETNPKDVEILTGLARSLGSDVMTCAPDIHDQAVAWISHLPVFVSAGLIEACGLDVDPIVLQLAQRLASSGFRDTSRVGGGNPELGMMMAQHNRTALLQSLRSYQQQIAQFIAAIEAKDWVQLQTRLAQAQKLRPDFVD
ncbi:MAG: prephenate/arogenate dehydrogenase [Cyanobacteria bacterium P01_H01_bin.15]